jgi:hypothetical protein
VRKLALFAVLRLMLEPSINDLRRKYYCKIVFSGCVKQYFSSLLGAYSTMPMVRTPLLLLRIGAISQGISSSANQLF